MTRIDLEHRYEQAALWVLAGATAVLALYIFVTTAYWVAGTFQAIPFYDQWAIVFLVQNLDQPNFLPHLWEQHNEHRIVIPRLISLADYAWFHGRGTLDLVSIWILQIGTAAVVFDLGVRAMAPLSEARPWRLFAGALIVALLFSVTQIDNLAFPFQTCFIGMTFFAALAFFCLDRSTRFAPEQRGAFWAWTSGAVVASVASMLCLASGILTPIVLVIGGYLSRWPKRALAVAAVAALVSILCYMHGYLPQQPMEPLAHVGTILLYAAVYLGSITQPGDTLGRTLDAAIGVGVLGLLIVVLLRLWKAGLLVLRPVHTTTNEHLSPTASANVALLCIVAVGIGQALITALGRYNFGVDQATSGRYYSVRLLIWACVVLMVLGIAARARAQRGRWTLVAAVLGLCAVVTLASEQWVLGEAATANAAVRVYATDSLLSGVVDRQTLAAARADPDVILGNLAFLGARRLSLYADPWFGALGQPIQSMVVVRPPQACIGLFESISQDGVTGGAKVDGWAWSVTDKRPFDRIILVDEQDRVVGLAAVSVPREDVIAAMSDVRTKYVGWHGYARTTEMVSAYGIIDRKFACKLHGAFANSSADRTGDASSR